MSEAHAEDSQGDRAQTGERKRRGRTARLVVYVFSGLLTVWLVASVVVALINGLSDDTAVDPFTQERVHSTGDAP